jgi:hypothetical protein
MTAYSTDNFQGYQLRACEEFWNLTPIQVSEIAHGCGPGKGWKESIIPDIIFGVSLQPACIIHDIDYFFGETRKDKDEADQNFLHNMLEINNQDSRFFLAKWLRRKIIFEYYSIVADIGGVAFWKEKLCD